MCSCFSFIQGPLGAAGPPGFPGGPGPKVSVMPLPVASQRGSRLGWKKGSFYCCIGQVQPVPASSCPITYSYIVAPRGILTVSTANQNKYLMLLKLL